MANELQFNINLNYSKNGVTFQRNSGTVQTTITSDYFVNQIQNVGTSAENLVVGDIADPGYILAHNIDGTNYVEIGHDETGSFVADVVIKAGKWALFEMSQATPQAKANSAAVKLEYWLIGV